MLIRRAKEVARVPKTSIELPKPSRRAPKSRPVKEDGDRFGVLDSRKVYNQHALARILGCYDYRWVLRNLFANGLPHFRIGNQYLVSGQDFNDWIRDRAAAWPIEATGANKATALAASVRSRRGG
jgi:hypothetical protein